MERREVTKNVPASPNRRRGVAVVPLATLWAHVAMVLASPPITPLADPLYSFDLMSPAVTQGFVKADDVLVLGSPYPVPLVSGTVLGLGAAGDELDGLSGGHPLVSPEEPFLLLFSVNRDSPGTAPPDPALVAIGLPYNVFDQAARGHQAGDEFMSTLSFSRAARGTATMPGNNVLSRNNYDEGGTDFAARPETSAHSVVAEEAQDNVDALADAAAGPAPYFSASRLSPSLGALPGSGTPSGAHVFRREIGGIVLFASFADLGLVQDDDIDGLVVFDIDGDGGFDGPDHVLFSLTPDSPSLATIDEASAIGAAADVFLASPGQAPRLFASAVNLGLGADSDDIDGLEILLCGDPIACVEEHGIRETHGDFDGDGDVDSSDVRSFDSCFSGQNMPHAPGCSPGDFDEDADVDCADWSGLVNSWSEGSPPPPQAECATAVPAVDFRQLLMITLSILVAGAIVFRPRSAVQGSARSLD